MIKEVNKYKVEDLQTKSFIIEVKGYKVEEVNQFLDEIQKDYIYFLDKIKSLKEENFKLKQDNNKLIAESETLKAENEDLYNSRNKLTKAELSKSDVVHRISNIESQLNIILTKLNINEKE